MSASGYGRRRSPDDGPLTDEQIAWLRAQFPDSHFAGEEPLGPPLW